MTDFHPRIPTFYLTRPNRSYGAAFPGHFDLLFTPVLIWFWSQRDAHLIHCKPVRSNNKLALRAYRLSEHLFKLITWPTRTPNPGRVFNLSQRACKVIPSKPSKQISSKILKKNKTKKNSFMEPIGTLELSYHAFWGWNFVSVNQYY